MNFSPTQKRCFAAVRQTCIDVLPQLEWLESLAKDAPQYADEVRELADVRDHLMTLCEGCLAAALPRSG